MRFKVWFKFGFGKLKAGIIVFLGTNCDRDTEIALNAAGFETKFIFHTETNLSGYDLIVLPGGFSFGDYIRAGRLAKLSPVVFALREYVKNRKGFVFGICNGFQILCEAGFLPGALVENVSTRFISRDERLIFNPDPVFGDLQGQSSAEEIILPVAHKEGCFYADESELKRIEKENTVFLRYKNNPNGSLNDIAGLYDRKNRVFGMMPHPERAVSKVLGNTDGFKIFNFIKNEILCSKSAKHCAFDVLEANLLKRGAK